MPLVPAKCPICGAMLNIESEKEAAVCQSCGNAFVVEKAINNYNTYNSVVNNITSDSVVVQMESEKERLNTNAETYIKLGEVQKALTIYQELVEKYPNDWRGWKGVIYYQYGYCNENELRYTGVREELSKKMAYFEKVASLEEYQNLNEAIQLRYNKAKEAVNEIVEADMISDLGKIKDISHKIEDTKLSCKKTKAELQGVVPNREFLEKRNTRYTNICDAIGVLPYIGILIWAVLCIITIAEGTDFFMVLVGGGLIGAGIGVGLWIVSSIIIALLPGKQLCNELSDIKNQESVLLRQESNLEHTITQLESELSICTKRYEYKKSSKEFIVANLPENIEDFVDEQLSAKCDDIKRILVAKNMKKSISSG